MTSHGADNDKYYLGIIQVIMFFCCNCYPKEDGEKMFTNVFWERKIVSEWFKRRILFTNPTDLVIFMIIFMFLHWNANYWMCKVRIWWSKRLVSYFYWSHICGQGCLWHLFFFFSYFVYSVKANSTILNRNMITMINVARWCTLFVLFSCIFCCFSCVDLLFCCLFFGSFVVFMCFLLCSVMLSALRYIGALVCNQAIEL